MAQRYCPSYLDEAFGLQVFMDYEDVTKREYDGGLRFSVIRTDDATPSSCRTVGPRSQLRAAERDASERDAGQAAIDAATW